MEPKMEQPKQYTPEEMAELEKSRTASDKALGDGGAEFVFNEKGKKENLLITDRQKDDIHKDVVSEKAKAKTEMLRLRGETLEGAEKVQFIKDWLHEIGAEDGNKEIEVTFKERYGEIDTATGYYRDHASNCFGLTDKPRQDKGSSDTEGLCYEFDKIEKIEEL